MKETKTKSKKRVLYYCILAISVLLLAAAIVLTVYFVSGGSGDVLEKPDQPGINDPIDPPTSGGDEDPNKDPNKDPEEDPNKPTGGGDVEKPAYVSPLATNVYTAEYGEIYRNTAVNMIYRHYALDFTAEANTEVVAMADGTVSYVSYNANTGNIITVDHGDGLQSVYRFVEPVEGLGKGDKVKKGECIGTVAEAYGSEKKEGTHLHFEVLESGNAVNPTKYIEAVLAEK